jgi:hypothetical protein
VATAGAAWAAFTCAAALLVDFCFVLVDDHDLTRVHNVRRVNGSLDDLHQLHGAGTHLRRKEMHFAATDACRQGR